MSDTNQPRVGDTGTIFRGLIKDQDEAIVDISGATSKQIILKRPDGTSITEDADFYTDGTDGILQYAIQSGDLNICGKWQIQWYVALTSGSWKTTFKTFKVYGNIT